MKLRQLQCLCAVADAGINISRAAGVLHATQPAISKQLQQFEQELGTKLLLRQGGRPVALTQAGERVLVWARLAVQCSDGIKALAREGGSEGGGTICVATSHAHASYLLLPAIVAFHRRCPLVRLTVLMGTPEEVAELVRDGKAAIGVVQQPEELPKEIVAVPVLTSRQMLVMPSGHFLQKERKLTLEKIATYPLIVQSSSRPPGAHVARKLQKAGLDVKIVVQALDADVIKTYAGCGLGVGVIPAFAYSPAKDRGLRARDVGHLFDPTISVVLLRRQGHLNRFLFDFLSELDPALERSALESRMLEGA